MLCDSAHLDIKGSPISLIWENGFNVENAYTLTRFPMDTQRPQGQQYEWRASAKAPLLVFDPEGKRTVTEATQLFGNHTFGKSWAHGYQALATLDKNSNGKVSGDELKPLALWFDANRNGISEPGEVKGVTESGVVNIYVTPDRTDPKNGWVHASKGFDRQVNGKLETLPSVDWFAKAHSGTGAAVAAASLTGSGDTPTTASSQTAVATPSNTPVGTPNWKDRLDAVQAAKKAAAGGGGSGSGGGGGGGAGGGSGQGSAGLGASGTQAQADIVLGITGTWLWASTPNVPSVENKVGDGILVIGDVGGGILQGTSILEVPLEPNPSYAAKALLGFPLEGTFEGKGSSGEEAYRFLVVATESGQVTTTTAVLSADHKTLKGKSATKTDSGTLEYEWTAIRLPAPEEE